MKKPSSRRAVPSKVQEMRPEYDFSGGVRGKHAARNAKGSSAKAMPPLVALIMGSRSDWSTMKQAAEMLDRLGIPHEVKVISAHRTPDFAFEYAAAAEARGIEVLIAGAGGAAHLPGVMAAKTILPVLGVPMDSRALKGLDSLLSMAQMPAGVPVGTLGIGESGAKNAALLAAAILAGRHPEIRRTLQRFREKQTRDVLEAPDPREPAEAGHAPSARSRAGIARGKR